MAEKYIRGYKVKYGADAAKGIEHLAYVLSWGEADSLFRAARLSGKIKFEDRVGRNFTLISHPDGNFEVKGRSGWW